MPRVPARPHIMQLIFAGLVPFPLPVLAAQAWQWHILLRFAMQDSMRPLQPLQAQDTMHKLILSLHSSSRQFGQCLTSDAVISTSAAHALPLPAGSIFVAWQE